MLVPRPEADVERGRQHLRRDVFLERRLHRPAAFAGIGERYESLDEYLTAEVGLTATDRARLREMYLE